MHSDHAEVESRLRHSRSAGMMTPPACIRFDAAALPERESPRRRLSAAALTTLCLAGLAAAWVSVLLFAPRAPEVSASEAVARSFETIPQTGADVTRRILAPVRREMESLAVQSRRASESLRGGLQQLR
ncbi:MAG: hypothetical protein KF691_01125 [Phycisphaeraceae bacterium]|nr:hypothetical protein [Phycisphaeraceae bacterium]